MSKSPFNIPSFKDELEKARNLKSIKEEEKRVKKLKELYNAESIEIDKLESKLK